MWNPLDNWSQRGTTLEELKVLLSELDDITIVSEPFTADDLKLYCLDPSSDYKWVYGILPTTGAQVQLVAMPSDDKVKQELVLDYQWRAATYEEMPTKISPELFDEAHRLRYMISTNEFRRPSLMSESAINDLFHIAQVFGVGTKTYSFFLLNAIQESLKKPLIDKNGDERKRTIRFMYRIMHNYEDRVKVFAVLGKGYTRINQSVLIDMIEGMVGVGKPEVKNWTVDQYFTKVQVDFPEIADDFSASYFTKDVITPGVLLRTSDSGKSAIAANACICIGSREAVPVCTDHVAKRHHGRCLADSIVNKVNLEIFRDYKQFPERLEELTKMNTPIPVDKGFKAALQAMKLDPATINEEVLSALQERLISSCPSTEMLPYDIAVSAVYAFTDDQLTANQQEHLRSRAIRAVFAKYESIGGAVAWSSTVTAAS